MAVFVFQARDMSGQAISGEISANSPARAREEIGRRGLFPISIKIKSSGGSLSFFQPKVDGKLLASLTRQFEVMFTAGMPIDRALGILSAQVLHKGLRQALLSIQHDVATGARLSEAFKKFPEYFNDLYCNMIEMGQAGGILDKTLKELAKILEKENHIRTKVKSSTLYPKIVVVALLGVFWGMLTFVFPVFADFYKGYGAELPLPTRIMIIMSTIAKTYWYVPLSIIIATTFLWKKYTNTDNGKRVRGRIAFKMPVFGKLNLLVANARFGHLTAALYRAGVSLPQTLSVVAGTVDNAVFSEQLRKIREELEQGKSLSEAMKSTTFFTPMVMEACAVGEQTGKLDNVLATTAQFYDEEVEDMIKNLTTLIEPFMIFFLFGAVLLLALAVYLPIWNMSKTVLH